jgi:hypothetical protein
MMENEFDVPALFPHGPSTTRQKPPTTAQRTAAEAVKPAQPVTSHAAHTGAKTQVPPYLTLAFCSSRDRAVQRINRNSHPSASHRFSVSV